MNKTSLNTRQAPRGLRRLGALLLTLAWSVAVLAVPASAAIVLPDLPSDQCVVDDAGVLSQSTFTYFDELNGTLESSCSGAQIALLTVQYTGSAETEDYAVEAFNTWGVGSASENNGVLILLVMESPYYEDGDYYITLGDGFRNTTLSKQVSTIAQETMEDSFVAGDYDAAAQSCAAEIANMIADQYGVTLGSSAAEDEQPWEESAPADESGSGSLFEDLLWLVVFLLIGFGMLVFLFSLLGSIFFVPVGRMFGWTWGPFGWYSRRYRNPPRGGMGGPRGPGGMGGRPGGNMGGPRGGMGGGSRPGGGRSGGGRSGGGSRPSGGSMGGGRSGGGGHSGGFGGMGGGGSHGGGGGRGR